MDTNIQTSLGLKVNTVEVGRIRSMVELTIAAFSQTASVPEKLFAIELIEYLVRQAPDMILGSFSELDIEDFEEAFDWGDTLEMFINPPDLFLGGKIRPDIVFRKGKGNYIVFEVDSFQFHSSQEALVKDKIRERKIQSLGYPVYRFAAKEILETGGAYSCAVEAIKTLERHNFV